MARYTKFVRGLKESPSSEVAVLFGVTSRDVRSTTGSNMHLLRMETGLDPLSTTNVKIKEKMSLKLAMVPGTDEWRLPYLARLLGERGDLYYRGEETEEITSLIDSLCMN